MRAEPDCFNWMLHITITATLLLAACATWAEPDGNWPGFRGKQASGLAEGYKTADSWNVEAGENIRWKTPIPGLGHSSPVVWGRKLFITTAIQATGEAKLKSGFYDGDWGSVENNSPQQWRLYCLDKITGQILWERTCHQGVPKIKRHAKSTHANPTAATDGRRVIAFFGSEGLFCFDMDGHPMWQQDLGLLDSGSSDLPSAQWGFASSPVIHDNLVIVQCDVQKGSFIAAYDITNGDQIWRTPRDDVPTWTTPTVDVSERRAQVIANGYRHIGGYDLRTGAELWRMTGQGDIPVPAPIVAHKLIFITNGHGAPGPIYAIRRDATGDLNADDAGVSPHIAWQHDRGGNYMQTPIVVGDHLYLCSDSGVLSCFVAKTGERVFRERLPVRSSYTASPVAADGKIYVTAETGEVVVVKAQPVFKILAVNDLGETCLATPAISEGMLLFRTRHHLIAVADEQ